MDGVDPSDLSLADWIAEGRRAGLDVLQPTASELERGLALHEEALVAESYCLGMAAPFDPKPLSQIVDRKGTVDEFVARASELSVLGWVRTPELREDYRMAWNAAGVDLTFQNAGEEGNDPVRLLYRFSNYSRLIERMPDFLCKAVNPADIPLAKAKGKRTIALSCNGVPLPGQFRSSHEELALIPVFSKLGMRMAHLTYNRRNPMGDGCGETSDGGLSDFGRMAIHELHRCGVVADLAHTGWKSCLDSIAESDRPLVVSHSAVFALHESIRAKPDNVIRALVDKGGVMGITNVPGFLGLSRDLCAILDHLDYLINNFGADSACIGTDKSITHPALTRMEDLIPPKQPSPLRWESLWPGGSDFGRAADARSIASMRWTNWPLITVGLLKRGHKEDTIRKVIGGNFIRVFQEICSRAEPEYQPG